MIAHRRRNLGWAAVACCAFLAVAGCGSDGTSSAFFPPSQPGGTASVSGTLYGPNGSFAAAPAGWNWADALTLVRCAYALKGIAPVTTGQNVALLQLDPTDAAHGGTTHSLLLANAVTDQTGSYQITHPALADLGPRLIVQVGSDAVPTRAFVAARITDIDATSEAVVRLVLRRLMHAPAVHLDDFTATGLQQLLDKAELLSQDISGDNVADLNESVYQRLANSKTMENVMDDVTGVPVATP